MHITMDYLLGRVKILESGCWEWAGARSKDGYGVLRVGGRQQIARRVFWEWFVGEIPTGQAVAQEMNLKCSGRICCNPAHLRLRNISDPVDWATCSKGHRLIPSNVMVEKVNGIAVRRCRVCRLEYWKNRKAQQRSGKTVVAN
jgi:hypothetical protein